MHYDLLIDFTLIAAFVAVMIWGRVHFGSSKGLVIYAILGLGFGASIVALDLTGHRNADILAVLVMIVTCAEVRKHQARREL